MELSRNLLCRKLGVEKGVLDFVNGLLFYQFFGGLSTDSSDDGGEIFRCDTKDGGIIADGIMLTEILLYRVFYGQTTIVYLPCTLSLNSTFPDTHKKT